MRLSIAIFATYLATITVALPTTPSDAKPLDTSNPIDNLIFSYGGGPIGKAKREQCDGDPTNLQCWQNKKRCDITDLECWQHGHGIERRGSESGPVYGIPSALED